MLLPHIQLIWTKLSDSQLEFRNPPQKEPHGCAHLQSSQASFPPLLPVPKSLFCLQNLTESHFYFAVKHHGTYVLQRKLGGKWAIWGCLPSFRGNLGIVSTQDYQ